MLIPVILSGGSGTRLWPLSRELYPKQLLPLVGKGTMLQETLARLAGVEGVGEPIVAATRVIAFSSPSSCSKPGPSLRRSFSSPQGATLRRQSPSLRWLRSRKLNPRRPRAPIQFC